MKALKIIVGVILLVGVLSWIGSYSSKQADHPARVEERKLSPEAALKHDTEWKAQVDSEEVAAKKRNDAEIAAKAEKVAGGRTRQ